MFTPDLRSKKCYSRLRDQKNFFIADFWVKEIFSQGLWDQRMGVLQVYEINEMLLQIMRFFIGYSKIMRLKNAFTAVLWD